MYNNVYIVPETAYLYDAVHLLRKMTTTLDENRNPKYFRCAKNKCIINIENAIFPKTLDIPKIRKFQNTMRCIFTKDHATAYP